MSSQFAEGKKAFGYCDRCGQRYLLKRLKTETVKGRPTNTLVCPECWDPDHPQLKLGMFPVNDPQALRNPRPNDNLIESRDIQWGWNPVGGARSIDDGLTPNDLVADGSIGTVTVSVS